MHDYWKTMALTRRTFAGKVMSLRFNMLLRLVITFLPRSKCLLISWLQSPSTVVLLLLSHFSVSDSVRPHRRQPTRLLCPWDSLGKNTGVGCHFLLQCMKVKVKSLSRVWLLATPWTAAYQAPRSMGFSRQEYWSGLPLPSPVVLEPPQKIKSVTVSPSTDHEVMRSDAMILGFWILSFKPTF